MENNSNQIDSLNFQELSFESDYIPLNEAKRPLLARFDQNNQYFSSVSLTGASSYSNIENNKKIKPDYTNSVDIIEKYTEKLARLQQKLNEQDENECVALKQKFKQTNELKRDTVVRKLLKTIDLMNQELNKRDKLISNIEKENSLLTTGNNNELVRLERERAKLSKQVEMLEKKNSLEVEINEKFERVVKQKQMLEQENMELCGKLRILEKEFFSFNDEILKAKTEMFELNKQLDEKERELNKYITALEKLGDENSKKSTELNELKEKNDSLSQLTFEQQKQIQKLFEELSERNEASEKNTAKKCEELKRLKQAANLSAEKLKYVQAKHESTLDEMKKKHSKELEQLRFSNEQTSARNGELSRSNGEMRRRLQQLESELKEINEKYFLSAKNVDILGKQKKELKEELERVTFSFKKEIVVQEQLRDEYLKKNNAQQNLTEKLLEKIAHAHTEFELLAKRNTDLEEKLKKTSVSSEYYKKKFMQLKECLKKEMCAEQRVNEEKSSIRKLFADLKLDCINDFLNSDEMNRIDLNEDEEKLIELVEESSIAGRDCAENDWSDLKIFNQ